TRSDSRVIGTAEIAVNFGKQVKVAPINWERCRPIVSPSGFPLASHLFRPADVALHQQRPELLEKRDIRGQLVCAFAEPETVIARWKQGLDSKDDGRSIGAWPDCHEFESGGNIPQTMLFVSRLPLISERNVYRGANPLDETEASFDIG